MASYLVKQKENITLLYFTLLYFTYVKLPTSR